MRISDWSSDVCSSDLVLERPPRSIGPVANTLDPPPPSPHPAAMARTYTSFADFWPFYLREHSKPSTRALHYVGTSLVVLIAFFAIATGRWGWLAALPVARSEEHTSELQSLMRLSYAVFFLKKNRDNISKHHKANT